MELWDLYDINRNKIGKTIQRGELLSPGEYHLVVHVCLFNSQGEMLIQQRQPFKKAGLIYGILVAEEVQQWAIRANPPFQENYKKS